ncbi:hypothetical protein FB45DRAFT_938199 [Roridomyces roridus]|uniref:Uncharacterized protein n=1 Tax=Roridomyces roridus TaxID=1738132 RepID=A0AAD7B845_9AGAR|nr:hypothetical protein FB45DRAFT_938199 [Roridomyces roridus]
MPRLPPSIMPPPRRTVHDQTPTMPTSTLLAIVLPPVVLGMLLLCAWLYASKLSSRRRHRAEGERLIRVNESDFMEEEMSTSSQGEIVEIHEDTREGLALTVAVIPPDTASPAEKIASGDPETRHSSIGDSSTLRRQYLENELRRVQEQIVDVDRLTISSSRMSLAAPGENEVRDLEELLKVARDRNAMLMRRIDELERQMQSAWALGLSDEPPPGYSSL